MPRVSAPRRARVPDAPLRVAALAVLQVVLAGCAEAPPPPVVAARPAALPSPPAPPDVSAVPPPPGLLAEARVSHPMLALKTALGWSRLPPLRAADVNRALAGEGIGEVADLDQPIDAALVNGGRGLVPSWAVAAGVRSLEAARAGLDARYTLSATRDGAYAVRPAGDDRGTTDRPCVVAPSAGPTPYRLVCGASEEALAYLTPYLARTASRRAVDPDVRVVLSTEPLKPFARMMRYQAPALLESMLDLRRSQSPALAELVEGLVGDLVDLVTDLGETRLDVALDPDGATATLHAGFKTKTSLLARLATSHPERAGAPLPAFFRLPGDSDTALFSRGFDAQDYEHARDLTLAAVRATFAQEGLPEADQVALVGALRDVVSEAPFVYARGSDVVAVQKALLAFQTAAEGPDKEKAARAAVAPYLGFWVFGFDEPPARLTGLFKGALAAWNRPSMSAWLKAHLDGVPVPRLRALPAAGLPRDASHVELAIYIREGDAVAARAVAPGAAPGGAPAAKARGPAPAPILLHALVVPDAGRTWLVLAADEKLALAKAKGLLAGASPGAPGTLATLTRLDAVRSSNGTGGGFTSLRGFVALSPEPDAEAPRGKAGDPLGLLASLPSQGVTPIAFSVTATPAGGDDAAGALEARVSLPRAAIEDILQFTLRSGGKP